MMLTGVLTAAMLSATGFVSAQETGTVRAPEVRPELWAKFREVNGSDQRRKIAAANAADRALFCSSCHGKDGNGTRPHIPKLAGQNASYILEQLEKFSDGRRKHYVMVPLAKEFSDADKIGFAIHFSGFTLKPAGGDDQLAAKGAPLYSKLCVHCHGEDGRGSKGYARLAGQQPVYVEKQLGTFRDKGSERHSELMEQVANSLSNHQIKSLANYIGQMK
jgi:cytochrome c553